MEKESKTEKTLSTMSNIQINWSLHTTFSDEEMSLLFREMFLVLEFKLNFEIR